MSNPSNEEAAREAVRRWGPRGHVRYQAPPDVLPPYEVGAWNDTGGFVVHGRGDSWAAAFAAASRKGAAA